MIQSTQQSSPFSALWSDWLGRRSLKLVQWFSIRGDKTSVTYIFGWCWLSGGSVLGMVKNSVTSRAVVLLQSQ